MLHYERQAVSAKDFPFLSLLQARNGSGTAILNCAVKKGCLWSAFAGQSLCFNTMDCQFTLCSDDPHTHSTVQINMYCVNFDCDYWTDSVGLFSCIV